MRKVLLVDDEILVRVGLKSVIDWEENGYVISGEAADGFEALEKIKADTPDIVLTDLMMDRMNGFELIRRLKKDYPHIGIVVLSCYNDFDNVKEAMRLGAMDYVFKLTLKPDELIKTLKYVEGLINPTIVRKENTTNDNKIVLKNINAIKASVLKKAIEGNYARLSSLTEEMQELRIRVRPDIAFMAMVVAVDGFLVPEDSCKIKERELLKFSLLNITGEVIEGYNCCDVFDYKDGKLVLIYNITEIQRKECVESVMRSAFEQIKDYSGRYLGIKVSAGISRIYGSFETLGRAIDEAEKALSNRFFKGNGKCFLYTEDDTGSCNSIRGPLVPDNLQLRYLEDLVQIMDEERIEGFVKEYLNNIGRTCTHSEEKARCLILELLYPFINSAKIRGFDINDIKDQCGLTPYQAIVSMDTLEDVNKWFLEFIKQFITAGRGKNEKRARLEIVKAMEYVNANIGCELNITAVSKHVNMSESYFSHLFKKETGESFVDYVNRTRIEKAKEMIINSDYKIYEIASMVGIDNANYFSILFKKITGKSPNDYRL